MRFALTVAFVFLAGACALTFKDYVERGNEFVGKRNDRAALEQYALACQKAEPDHRLHHMMASAHARLGQYDKAIEHFEKASEILKKVWDSVSEQAQRITTSPAEAKRIRYYIQDRINPLRAKVYTDLGMLYEKIEEHASAVLAFQLALLFVEGHLWARMELAKLMERKRDKEAALREWQRFVKDAEKASPEEKSLYNVDNVEIKAARRRIERFILEGVGQVPEGLEKK